jgi:hypothetical protein
LIRECIGGGSLELDLKEPPARLAGRAKAAEEVAGGDDVPAVDGLVRREDASRLDDGHGRGHEAVLDEARARHVPAHLLTRASGALTARYRSARPRRQGG